MRIKVVDFLSIKYAEFEIEKGINVIAGKNGSGKSQMLLGIAQKVSKSNLLKESGFSDKVITPTVPQIEIEFSPSLVLYRPPIRHLAENERTDEFGFCRPLNEFINSNDLTGYTSQVQNRSKNIYAIISNFAIAANNKYATPSMQERWNILTSTFFDIFGKELLYDINIFNGIKVGVRTGANSICSLNTLSTGELELISLMCDLLLEYSILNTNEAKEKNIMTGYQINKADMILIDELDSHFHPDLQRKIIKSIEDLCKDKYVIISTHSPSVMLSVSPDKLFYLSKCEECFCEKNNSYKNQITKISEDSILFRKISELYSGFSIDIRFAEYVRNTETFELIKYAEECMKDPEVFEGDRGKETGTQEYAIQNFLLAYDNPVIVEIGCGLGRTLAAFNSLDSDFLSKTSYFGVDIRSDNVRGLLEYAKKNKISSKFKEFDAGLIFDKKADICIFANVIHEIPRQELVSELKKYLGYLKKGGKALILECLELPVGEKDYVVFDFPALKLLLNRGLVDGSLCIKQATPKTYTGIPLMNAVITVNEPEKVYIQESDLTLALKSIVETECKKLKAHFNGQNPLSSRAFAHATHNLAHAQMSILNL